MTCIMVFTPSAWKSPALDIHMVQPSPAYSGRASLTSPACRWQYLHHHLTLLASPAQSFSTALTAFYFFISCLIWYPTPCPGAKGLPFFCCCIHCHTPGAWNNTWRTGDDQRHQEHLHRSGLGLQGRPHLDPEGGMSYMLSSASFLRIQVSAQTDRCSWKTGICFFYSLFQPRTQPGLGT